LSFQNNNNGSTRDELPQLPQSLDEVVQWAANRSRRFYLLLFVVAALLWFGTGVYVVQPGEEGVVQTFGRFTGVTTSGLNYHLPAPIQQVRIVDVASIRRAEIGFRSSESDRQDVLGEALMLTADENIVQVQLLVQYRIADSRAFVFNVQNPEDVLLTSAEVGLRSTVGRMTIDAVITEERARVQEETRTFLSRLMEDYTTGIQITDVRLQVADPPADVRDAFQEVVRALADKERLINEAQAYQNDIVPRARGDKQKLIEEATAFKEQRILRAKGDADRFLSILEAYRLAPEVTRERMHIEALEAILQRVELTLIDNNAIGGQLLPLLPLRDLQTTNLPASAPAPVDAALEGGE
jgi:membrane protease subunit HflK